MPTRPAISGPDDATPAECRPTIDRLQSVMDGDESASTLTDDFHAKQCPACRGRMAAARLVSNLVAEPGAACAARTNALLAAVEWDRTFRRRRLRAGVAACMAIAAAVLLAVSLRPTTQTLAPQRPAREFVQRPPTPPVWIGESLADAGDALARIGRRLTDPAAQAPPLLAPIADAFRLPPAYPTAADFEPAARSLAELPEAARHGLEPVTGPAARVFTRSARDVSAVQPGPKVKS